jgi:lysophospholipase L1-like esterase
LHILIVIRNILRTFSSCLIIASSALITVDPAFCKEGQSNSADRRTSAQANLSPGEKQTARSPEPSCNRFETDILSFEKADAAQSPATHGTVFVGSSTFTLWKDLEKTFSEFKPLNRGFGGSTFPDINHYVKRIVTKYQPDRIVLYAGTNDIAELHHSGARVFADFKKFVSEVKADLPKAEIYFVSMSMAPCRRQFAAEYQRGNLLIRNYINSASHLHYIDVLPVMRNKSSELRTELFGPDELHMNPGGYALWTPVIRKALQNI